VPLHSDKERLSLALAAAKLGDWSWDAASDLVTFSARAAEIFQVPVEMDLTRTRMRTFLHPDDVEWTKLAVQRALETHRDYALEYRLVNGTGLRWVAAQGRGLYDENGAVLGMLGIVQDVTEIVRTRETLRLQSEAVRESEERYRAFIENSSEGIWRLEFTPPIDTALPVEEQVEQAYTAGRLAECNLVMAQMYGLASPQDLIGKGLDLMLPASDPQARAYLASIIEAGYRVSEAESRELDAHGAVKYFSNSMNGVIVDGQLQRMWGMQRDITDRKRGEHAQAYLAAIIDSADDAIISKDLNGVIQWCNASAERVFGFTAAELVGKPVRILIPPDRQAEEDDILAKLARGERIEHFETVRLRKNGQPINVSLTVSPVRDANGVVIGASKVVRDITVQKRAAAELAAQQAWFRVTLGSIGDAVIASDPQGRVTFINGTASELTGWSEAEAVGRPLDEVFHILDEKTRQPVVNPASLVMNLGHVVGLANHTVLIGKDGRERPIADSAAPIRDADDRMLGVVLVFRDVSEDRRVEETLAEQREWLETTLKSIGDAVIATDVHGRIVFMNPVAEYLTGWSAEVARGQPFGRVFHILDEHHRQPVEDPLSRVLAEGGLVGFGHYTFLVSSDGAERTIDQSGAPIRNTEGRITGVVIVFRDVSERRRLDLERHSAAAERERLLDAERAARAEAERASRIKDEFMAMVSHELRTPLNAILGWTQLMMRGKHDPATLERGLDIVARNTRVQAQLIADLLDVSRIVSGKLQLDMQAVDLHAVATDAVETIRQEAETKQIAIFCDLDDRIGPVAGDPARLQQVVWNLLSNAVKFTPIGGRIEVALRDHGGNAQLSVSDNGAGIRPEVLPHVFDRFHQADSSITRRFGGLGLGLSIVKHLVDLHGGSVSADSAGEGRGASFTVSLPASPPGVGMTVPPPAGDDLVELPVSLRSLRVLVVDDEPDTRAFLQKLLEGQGAVVTVAASAEEALRAIREAPPQVLISDIGLPDVDGYDLIRMIREDHSDGQRTLPAIALTAYARAEDRARALRAGYQAHLAKPVEANTLLTTIGSFAGMFNPLGR
jgi:PAS domain S-box-containing protein